MEERYCIIYQWLLVVFHCVCVLIFCCIGSQLNKQHAPTMDHHELARETERLDRMLLTTVVVG